MNPKSFEQMTLKYENHLTSSRKCFFFERNCELNKLKSYEFLQHLNENFPQIAHSKTYSQTVSLNDLIVRDMKSNIYVFDATADIASDFKESKFKLVNNSGKKYSSKIEFIPFHINLKRWYDQSKISDAKLAAKLDDIADILAQHINSLQPAEQLLIVGWKYMSLQNRNMDNVNQDQEVKIIEQLSQRLDLGGFSGRYSIIHRGSGQDKATNAYQDYAAVVFLGEWKCKNITAPFNRNYGTKSNELKLRLAGMVQTICRIRIRKHTGEPIKIFYTEDIDKRLMKMLFDYFTKHTEDGVAVRGVPIFKADNRDLKFIADTRKLLAEDPLLMENIKKQTAYCLKIPLSRLRVILPKGKCQKESYRDFKQKLKKEYNITLTIL